jgi:dephospho-CoA kinase
LQPGAHFAGEEIAEDVRVADVDDADLLPALCALDVEFLKKRLEVACVLNLIVVLPKKVIIHRVFVRDFDLRRAELRLALPDEKRQKYQARQ